MLVQHGEGNVKSLDLPAARKTVTIEPQFVHHQVQYCCPRPFQKREKLSSVRMFPKLPQIVFSIPVTTGGLDKVLGVWGLELFSYSVPLILPVSVAGSGPTSLSVNRSLLHQADLNR